MNSRLFKRFFVLVLTTIVLTIILFPIPSIRGFDPSEVTLAFTWSQSPYYQGDSGSVTISLTSKVGWELEFTWVGIHFAWMQENSYYSLDLRKSPTKIPSGGSVEFSSITFQIPSDTHVGWNTFKVQIKYNEHLWYGWASAVWDSPTYQINIHDAYEKMYNDLKPTVTDKLNNAQKANYESPIAKSKVSQARDEYDLAVSLAAQGKWDGAVSHLQTSANILSEAAAEETVYQTTKQQQQQQDMQIWIYVLIIVIAIVIIIAVIVLRRR